MFGCIFAPALAGSLPAIAEAFAPAFELASADTAVFDVAPLGRLYGLPERIAHAIAHRAGEQAAVAIAPDIESAILIARHCGGVNIIERDAARALATLSIDVLESDPELLDTLQTWGIRTLGDLAALPAIGLAERLGEEGVYLRSVARGEAERPLCIYRPEEAYEDSIVLDDPVTLLEPLLFLIARMLNPLCARLESQALATNEVRVTLTLENACDYERVVRLPVPARDAKALLKLIQLDLEAHPPQAPMMAVAIALHPTAPRRIQGGMFLPPAPEPDKLEVTLARIRALVGDENAGTAELLDTHHPEPFRLNPQFAPVGQAVSAACPMSTQLSFRYFRPPLHAEVTLDRSRPVAIRTRAVRGRITTCAGPWRTSGHWWTDTPWDRDEWDIAVAGGALYRLYRLPDGAWFLEGVYD